jgi:hypothetical protein
MQIETLRDLLVATIDRAAGLENNYLEARHSVAESIGVSYTRLVAWINLDPPPDWMMVKVQFDVNQRWETLRHERTNALLRVGPVIQEGEEYVNLASDTICAAANEYGVKP